MNKLLILGLLIVSTSLNAAEKLLKYRFNEDVEISISTISCPFKALKDKCNLAAVAKRSDGQQMFGCYTRKNDNIIIQWDGGDQTIILSKYFLEY
jgi:hypothetical protein